MRRDPRELEAALASLDRQHLRRIRRTVDRYPNPADRTEVVVDGRCVVDFCGNDYLGLAHHPKLAEAMAAAAAREGVGSGAAHLVTGHGREHARLEEALAAYTGRKRALLFSTGYMANLAAITTLTERGERVLLDRLSHASLIDATLLSGASFKRYAHNDVEAAERALVPSSAKRSRDREGADSAVATVLATDGVFSMDGDLAPLPALATLCRDHSAWLVVDDAHGLGVIGATGRGTLEHFGLTAADVPLLVGTLGKAFGCFGAFVAGDADVIELLMQKSRSYIYTTALPQPMAAAACAALELAYRESWRRERVVALTARFRRGATRLGLPLMDSPTPIQPVVVGSAETALHIHEQLFTAGFWVAAIRPPTVPPDTARLRVTLSAAHTDTQVDALLEALGRACPRPNLSAPLARS